MNPQLLPAAFRDGAFARSRSVLIRRIVLAPGGFGQSCRDQGPTIWSSLWAEPRDGQLYSAAAGASRGVAALGLRSVA